MQLVDVHCHLDSERLKPDLEGVLARAKASGIKVILSSGVNPPSNRAVLELAKKHELIRASFGIYPLDALGIQPEGIETYLPRQIVPIDVDAELEWIFQHKDETAAIGEVGLDYKWVKDAELQARERENFKKIIAAVEKLKKPMIVHSRQAELDCIEMLESSTLKKIIFHSFTGRKHLVARIADNGWFFSIPVIVIKLQQFQDIVKNVPFEQILTETDAPWLGPELGKPNEPANIVLSIKKIAELKGLTPEETANLIYMNYQRIFE
ncbi:MAG: TatD family hydrolase [Candidatus Woesearchaeota archaeon]